MDKSGLDKLIEQMITEKFDPENAVYIKQGAKKRGRGTGRHPDNIGTRHGRQGSTYEPAGYWSDSSKQQLRTWYDWMLGLIQGGTNPKALDEKDIEDFIETIQRASSTTYTTKRIVVLKFIANMVKEFGDNQTKIKWDNTILLLSTVSPGFKDKLANNKIPDLSTGSTTWSGDKIKDLANAGQNNFTTFEFADPSDEIAGMDPIKDVGADIDDKYKDVAGATEKVKPRGDQLMQSLYSFDMRNLGGESGNFPADVNVALNEIFSGSKSIPERIQKITKFSDKMADALMGGTVSDPPSNFDALKDNLVGSMVLDYFVSMVAEMDGGSAPYLFETFCAAMCGGRVEGKSKTAQGRMGGTDFTLAGNNQGSAKFYSEGSTGGIKQAIGGFRPNTPMHYIVGVKKKAVGGFVGTGPAASVTEATATTPVAPHASKGEIIEINMFYFKVLAVPEQNTNGIESHHKGGDTDKELLPDGFRRVSVVKTDKYGNDISSVETKFAAATITVLSPSNRKMLDNQEITDAENIKLGKLALYTEDGETHMGTIKMLGRINPAVVKTYKEAMIEGAGNLDKGLKDALTKISTITTSSENLQSNVNQYAAGGKGAKGTKAIEQLVLVNNTLKNLFEWFAGTVDPTVDPSAPRSQVKGYEKVDTTKMSTMTESLNSFIDAIVKQKLLK
tara:strand:- start:38 stop:2056 length:2019 start_codon:yes stop_codon:yes gene_type:complete